VSYVRKILAFVIDIFIIMYPFFSIDIALAYSYPFAQTRNACNVTESDGIKFEVANAKSDDTFDNISCHDTYAEAVTAMHAYDSNNNNVAVVIETKNLGGNIISEIINAEYAIVDLNTKGDRITNVYDSNSYSSAYTYINGYWGSGAAFVDASVNVVSGNVVEVTGSIVNIRADHTTSSSDIGDVRRGDVFVILDTYQGSTYTWYKINSNGIVGWIADGTWTKTYTATQSITNKGIQIKISGYTGWIKQFDSYGRLNYEIIPISQVNIDEYYKKEDGDIKHNYSYMGRTVDLNIGPSPTFLNEGIKYYSFDGNYFYTDYTKMIDDYRALNFDNAINSDDVYFNYYMYLPNRNKSGYTANDINQLLTARGLISKPDPSVTYWNSSGTKINNLPTYMSVLVNEGSNFVLSQELYGVNAFQTFALALNESGSGRSAIAVVKNNIFGQGAGDSSPFSLAQTFDSVADSIMEHASGYVSNYSNPNGIYYFGSHYGNKNSGMAVKYASDPYWGEKQAQNYYYMDRSYGLNDYESNVLGVKVIDGAIRVRKEATTASPYIYELKNENYSVSNMPVIIVDVINGETIDGNSVWYKIQTDPPLDSDGNISTDAHYNWDRSVGYIHSSLLYVAKPVIRAGNQVVIRGSNPDYLEGISAYDSLDGIISDNISVDDSLVDIDTLGTYDLIYTVTNSKNKTTRKVVSVMVSGNYEPIITASDKSYIVGTDYNLLEGVGANDIEDGDISNLVSVESDIDINAIGVYSATYTVVDSDSNSVSKQVVINVLERPNTMPTIDVMNVYLQVGNEVDLLDYATGYDAEDGELEVSVDSNYDYNVIGNYTATYTVTDSDSNVISIEIDVVVEKAYTDKTGNFYFEKFVYDESSETFDFGGYLVIDGIDNDENSNIEYDFLLIDADGNRYVFDIGRWTDGVPFNVPAYDNLDFSGAWFSGNIDLSNVPEGDYKAYVRARSADYEALRVVSNVFLKPMSQRVVTDSGRGYQVRTDYYVKELPMELFIRDEGLISRVENPTVTNMFNFYDDISFSNGNMTIKGGSYSVGVDLSKKTNVERFIILENQDSFERVRSNDIGYIDNGPYKITLRYNDGFNKTRGWYHGSINVGNLDNGIYTIYINTVTDMANDYGELTDIFLRGFVNSYEYNNKRITLRLNKDERFRVELVVEDI